MKKIIDYLTEVDIGEMAETSDMKLVSELCGYPTAETLLRNMPGTRVYIPQITSRSLSQFMERVIKRMQDDGLSIKRIALTLGVSESVVYNQLREMK